MFIIVFTDKITVVKYYVSIMLQMERFRSRVVQVTFSTPGIKAPDTEISDDQLLDTLKKLINERTELQQKIKDMEGQMKMADTNSKEFQKCMSDIRKVLMNAKVIMSVERIRRVFDEN